MKIRYYISGHGLGHASRSCQIINTLDRLFPEIAVEISSDVPPGFFDTALSQKRPVRRMRLDIGAVQSDSLHIDLPGTLVAWRQLESRRKTLLAQESDSLQRCEVDLVVTDVAPLPCAAAQEVGIPSVVISNFTWDWILEGFAERDRAFSEQAARLRSDYQRASLVLRLPFHGEMPEGPRVEDLPLVARRSHVVPQQLRQRLQIPEGCRIGLISFGGFGLHDFDVSALGTLKDWVFLTERGLGEGIDNLKDIPPGCVPYPDLVALADVVITKPGYGIVSECIANATAVLYTSRGDFREQPLLIEALQRFTRSCEIGNADLLQGRWHRGLESLLVQPPPTESLACDGDSVAAEHLRRFLEEKR